MTVTAEEEGPNVRVRAGVRSYLFATIEREKLLSLYERYSGEAKKVFGVRWRSVEGENIAERELEEIVERVTLDALYFYNTSRLPVEISDADWAHPQALRVVQDVVERHHRGSAAAPLAAHLAGMSLEEYLRWKQGEQMFQDR